MGLQESRTGLINPRRLIVAVQFRTVNVASAGFYGYTLTNVLFLTGVWHYSVLKAGLSLTPGPFVAAAVAGPASKLVYRFGHRPVLVAGGLIWGGAVLWFVLRIGVRPEFLSEWLPGIVLLGLGAGTLFPNLSGAAVASAPGQSFATATGLNSVSRQLGAAIGVAVVVAVIGTPSPLHALSAFDHAWSFGAACLFFVALGSLLVRRLQVERSPSLASAAGALLRRAAAIERARPPRGARAACDHARRGGRLRARAPGERRRLPCQRTALRCPRCDAARDARERARAPVTCVLANGCSAKASAATRSMSSARAGSRSSTRRPAPCCARSAAATRSASWRC